ncbi:MAG: hypothetical protein ACI8UP_005402, partial [Porticoccaceae bacterium]
FIDISARQVRPMFARSKPLSTHSLIFLSTLPFRYGVCGPYFLDLKP